MRYPSNLISCTQPGSSGAISLSVARHSGTKSGRGAPLATGRLLWALGLSAVPGRRGVRGLFARLVLTRLARARLAALRFTAVCFTALRFMAASFPAVAPALTFSFTPRFECHTRLRPLPSAISGIERPVATVSDFFSSISGSLSLREVAFSVLLRSHMHH